MMVVLVKVSKGAKIRNRYNQVPHLTQDTNGKVKNSQLDTTNESQEVRCNMYIVFHFSSKYDIDMTSIDTRMFGIMFEVSFLVPSLKISTFMNKPLFIHASEKL